MMPFEFDDNPREWREKRDYEGIYAAPPDKHREAAKRSDAAQRLCAECGAGVPVGGLVSSRPSLLC